MWDNKTLINFSEQLTFKCRRKEPYINLLLLYFNIVYRSLLQTDEPEEVLCYLKLQIFFFF